MSKFLAALLSMAMRLEAALKLVDELQKNRLVLNDLSLAVCLLLVKLP